MDTTRAIVVITVNVVFWLGAAVVVVLMVRVRRRDTAARNVKASGPSAMHPLGTRIERRREPTPACTCRSRAPAWVAAKGWNASFGYASNGHESGCATTRRRRKITVEVDVATGSVVRHHLSPHDHFPTGR